MTTNSRHSASDPGTMAEPRASTAFDSYDPRIQRWIWQRGWKALRDIQERAAAPILAGDTDVVIASATASGKTEAAFFPICTRVSEQPRGLRVLCVSPLKALINDQHERLSDLCTALDLPVHRWHGDVPASRKQRFLREPAGILLITPESLEALFIIHGPAMPSLFADLAYVVIDELHAFIGTERGIQLQSLLHRVEHAARRSIPRIALSATLGDLDMACEYLRPGAGRDVVRIESTTIRQEIRLQLRGYHRTKPSDADTTSENAPTSETEEVGADDLAIASDLYRTLRGGRHLVFANGRSWVELFTDLLRRLSERDRVPNEFWAHHGNLSRELREDAESALKDGTKPATVIATTTLELGIDVGSVESIAQIGPPPSVASLRQRLGRSGRKEGIPSILRLYVAEEEVTENTSPPAALRSRLFQAVAMVQLLIEKWNEPPEPGALHLSTLVQQTLSLIAQHGGASALQAWRLLCQSGPFRAVDQRMFAALLRSLAAHDLLTQTHDGTLVLGLTGERLVNHYDFYAAFTSPDEYRLVAGSRSLGTIPLTTPMVPGMFLIFGGRRWEVLDVDDRRKVIDVRPAAGGRVPRFDGSGGLVHDRVRREMLRLYQSSEQPRYLDATALALLDEGRTWFRRYGLDTRSLLRSGSGSLIFPWAGDRIMNTLLIQLQARGLAVLKDNIAIHVLKIDPAEVMTHLRTLAEGGPADRQHLASIVQSKHQEKHHHFLSDDLLSADYASSQLDTEGAWRVVQHLVHHGDPAPPTERSANMGERR